MVALHSAVLDSITLSAPWTHRAVLHPHARTATGRVRLTPSRHLSLSPCPLRLHDPSRGREGALHACSHLRVSAAGVWRADTRVRRHQRGLSVGGGCALLHTHPAPPRCTAPPIRSPRTRPSPTTPQQRQHVPSNSTCGCSPSAGGGCHRAAQRCTHGLTVPSTSSRDRRACAQVEVG
jgi:hypothetical protein